MEDQNQRSNNNQPLVKLSPSPTQNQTPDTALPAKKELTDEDALNLLTVNRLQATKSARRSKPFLIVMLAIMLVVIATALYASSRHGTKNASGNSNSGLPNPTNNPINNGGSINQQVNYCSNVINAATVC